MAFTKEEHDNLLKEIAMTGGDTPKMLELMQKLRDDFDEREGELRRLHESADTTPIEGEEKADTEIREEAEKDNADDGGLRRDPITREEYENLRRAYINRFFGDGDYAPEADPDPEPEKSPEWEDLFKNKE